MYSSRFGSGISFWSVRVRHGRDQSVGWHEYEKADVIDHANPPLGAR